MVVSSIAEAHNAAMNHAFPKTDLAATLRQAMGPGFAFNSGGAFERFAANTMNQARRNNLESTPN